MSNYKNCDYKNYILEVLSKYDLMKIKQSEENLNRYKIPQNIPEFWYHGTNVEFDKFSLSKKNKNWGHVISDNLGIYFTDQMFPPPYLYSDAQEYAEHAVSLSGGNPIIYKCKIEFNKPLILNSHGWYSSIAAIDKQTSDIKRWLNNDNYDSILVYNVENLNNGADFADFKLVVWNPSQINIIESITATEKDKYNHWIYKNNRGEIVS